MREKRLKYSLVTSIFRVFDDGSEEEEEGSEIKSRSTGRRGRTSLSFSPGSRDDDDDVESENVENTSSAS